MRAEQQTARASKQPRGLGSLPISMTQKVLRVAGYHDNIREFARIVEESKIPKHIADNAWFEGKREREQGVPCSCYSCQRVN